MKRRHPVRGRLAGALLLCAGSLLLLALTGCGTGSEGAGKSPATAVSRVSGTVYGGQQPISRAAVQLYAANLTTLRGASRAMLTSAVTSDNSGYFDITGLYACSPGDLVYLVASGGDAGAGVNSSIMLVAALGPCSALSSATFITLNEVTTVASAYTLAPFMTDVQHVGATANLLPGLQNAFAMESVLADNRTGSAATPAQGRSIPVAELYSLADVLAGCVNSSASSTGCSSLMTATTTGARGVPSDTLGAALGIATAPGANVTALQSLVLPSAPFEPTLSLPPTDWSISLTLTGGGLKGPRGIALDSDGNAWIANGAGSSVSKFSPAGDSFAGAGGYTGSGLLGPEAIAIDPTGNVWVANTGGNSVVEISNAGSAMSAYTAGGVSSPVDLAIDLSGNIWIANYSGNSVSELSASGVAAGSSPLTLGGNVVRPTGIAVSATGDIWVASSGTGTLVSFTSGGALNTAGVTDNWLQGTGMLAVDPNGNAWVAAPAIGAITAVDASYTAASFSPDYDAVTTLPVALAVDGGGNIWVVDGAAAGTLSELSAGAGKAAPGITAIGAFSSALGVAIDTSGNVWITNSGNDSVTLLVGLAVPAVTPLVNRLR